MTPNEEFHYDLYNLKDYVLLYAKYDLLLKNISIVHPLIQEEADKASHGFHVGFMHFEGKWGPKDE